MAQSELSEQQRQTAFQRLLSVFPSASARLVTYGAAAAVVYSLYPNDPAGLMAASPILANLVATIGGDLLASMIEKVASKDDASPEEIVELLEQTLANTQIATALIQNLPTKHELYRVISLLYQKQDDRLLQLIQQSEAELTLLEQVLDELRRPQRMEQEQIYVTDDERVRILDMYLERVIVRTKHLPWGYLPGISTDLEISDVYLSPLLATKEQTELAPTDPFLERQIARTEEERQITHKDPGIGKSQSIPLYQMLSSSTYTAVLGYLGTGKSMTANYIAWALARKEGQRRFALAQCKVPLLVRLGDSEVIAITGLETLAIKRAVKDLFFEGDELAYILEGILEEEWKAKRSFLILDALDEFQGKLTAGVADELVRLRETQNHVLVTSRPAVYQSARIRGLKEFQLKELHPQRDRPQFIETWVKALLKANSKSDVDPRKHAQTLTMQIKDHDLVGEITTNPLFLTLLIVLNLRPEGIDFTQVRTENQLLYEFLNHVIEWEKTKGADEPNKYGAELLRKAFAYIGYSVQCSQTGDSSDLAHRATILATISSSKHFKHFKKRERERVAETCLTFWLRTGLLSVAEVSPYTIHFYHQAFQYFATALAVTYQSSASQKEIIDKRWHHSEWRDVWRLAIGLLRHHRLEDSADLE